MKLKAYIVASLFSIATCVLSAQPCKIDFSVVPITQGESVPDATQDYLLTKLSQLATVDGVSTDAAQSQFFITAKFNHITEDVTPGPPAQTVLHSYLTLYIGDISSQTVYATTTLELRGIGTSAQRAFINALRSVNSSNPTIVSFIEKGSKKVIDYFDRNYLSILSKARRAAEKNNFDEALWLLVSIPECCKGYKEAYALEQTYFKNYIDQVGIALYNAALAAWSAHPNGNGATKVFDFLMQIDPESSAYGNAKDLASEIKASVADDRHFELRQKYHDSIDLEKSRINAIREIGVAYGRGQQPSTTNLMWLK